MSYSIRFVAIGAVLASLTGCGTGERDAVPPTAQTGGSVTLQWDPVEANDLAGYKVYQSTAPGSLGTLIKGDIAASTTSYTAGNLQTGTTYFFVVKSFDRSGNESSSSNQVSRTIQ